MAARKRRKAAGEETDLEGGRGRFQHEKPAIEESDEESEARLKDNERGEPDVDRDLDLDLIAEPSRGNEPDSRAVDDLTDRIFRSVLSRYGWERHGNHIEHVGEERTRH